MFHRILAILPALLIAFASFGASAQPMEEEEEMMQIRSAPGSVDDGPIDTAGDDRAECSLTCPDGSDARAARDGSCTCDVDGSVQEHAHRCTAQGCADACAPNQCVGWRPNNSGGCNYSCLMNPRDPDRTVN